MVKAISENINEAKKHLLNSCPIIYPTDTLYSFGAMADDDVAIKKINKLKKRTSPISIIVSDIKEIEKYGHIHNKHKGLINNIFFGYGDFYIRLLFYMQKKKITIVEIPTKYAPRKFGVSKSKLINMIFTYSIAATKLVINNLFK